MNFVHEILAEPLAFHGPSLLPWLNRRERIAAHMAVTPREDQGLKEYFGQFVNQRRDYEVQQGIAIIHANDALARNTTPVDRALGMTDYSQLVADFEMAALDPNVSAVLLDLNSPGGSAIGAPEAAAALAALAQQKPVVSFVETMAASAAYYLCSASSAIVGSIGTICSFLDFAGLMERIGITGHIFTPAQSDLKATGTPFRAPTLAEANFLQSRTEALNADFTAWVSQHRASVTAEAMRGQYFTGTQAQALGLVDQVGNRADALAAAQALAAF